MPHASNTQLRTRGWLGKLLEPLPVHPPPRQYRHRSTLPCRETFKSLFFFLQRQQQAFTLICTSSQTATYTAMLRHAITSPARRLRLSQNRSKTVTTFTQRCLYSSNNHNDDNNPSSSPAANKPPPSPQTSYEGLPAPGEGTRITLDVSREGGSTVKLEYWPASRQRRWHRGADSQLGGDDGAGARDDVENGGQAE